MAIDYRNGFARNGELFPEEVDEFEVGDLGHNLEINSKLEVVILLCGEIKQIKHIAMIEQKKIDDPVIHKILNKTMNS